MVSSHDEAGRPILVKQFYSTETCKDHTDCTVRVDASQRQFTVRDGAGAELVSPTSVTEIQRVLQSRATTDIILWLRKGTVSEAAVQLHLEFENVARAEALVSLLLDAAGTDFFVEILPRGDFNFEILEQQCEASSTLPPRSLPTMPKASQEPLNDTAIMAPVPAANEPAVSNLESQTSSQKRPLCDSDDDDDLPLSTLSVKRRRLDHQQTHATDKHRYKLLKSSLATIESAFDAQEDLIKKLEAEHTSQKQDKDSYEELQKKHQKLEKDLAASKNRETQLRQKVAEKEADAKEANKRVQYLSDLAGMCFKMINVEKYLRLGVGQGMSAAAALKQSVM